MISNVVELSRPVDISSMKKHLARPTSISPASRKHQCSEKKCHPGCRMGCKIITSGNLGSYLALLGAGGVPALTHTRVASFRGMYWTRWHVLYFLKTEEN